MESHYFRDVEGVLRFLITGNPARQKSINFFEPDSRGSGQDLDHVWQLLQAITYKQLKSLDELRRVAFIRYYLTGDRVSVDEIAHDLGRTKRDVRRWLNEGITDLERIYQARGILPASESFQFSAQ